MHKLIKQAQQPSSPRQVSPRCGLLSCIPPLSARPIWLLVFDLDGTLIESSRDLCTSVNTALIHANRPVLPESMISSFIGDGAAALIQRALTATGRRCDAFENDRLFDSTFSYFLEFYREHKLDTTQLYPGVAESLIKIQHRNPELLMAVLTNKPVAPSREICAALGLSPFFFVIHGGNSFPTKKPDPEGLMSIVQEARDLRLASGTPPEILDASAVVMIGDSEVDVHVGRSCGTRVLGCSYGLAPTSLRRAGPDVMVSTPQEWLTAMGL